MNIHTHLLSSSLLLTAALAVGCAAPMQETPTDPRMIASMTPMSVPPPAEPRAPDVVETEASAAGWLERGFVHFQAEEHAAAANAFRAAVATGNLNDAGRALAYWHIFLSESLADNDDVGAEALAAFIVVGQDVLDSRTTMRYAVTSTGDFVERFDLSNRVSKARAWISAKWADRMPQFGQTLAEAVPVLDEVEADHFMRLAPPCRDAVDRNVHRDVIVAGSHGRIERVTIDCGAHSESGEYFLQFADR